MPAPLVVDRVPLPARCDPLYLVTSGGAAWAQAVRDPPAPSRGQARCRALVPPARNPTTATALRC